MKTIKSILITALIILGTALYAQGSQVEYITASDHEKTSRFETLLNGVANLADRLSGNETDEPLVCMSYTMDQAEVIYEEDYRTEAWMSAPFKSSVAEDELEMEAWMSAPFESSMAEVELAIESWMTRPFESNVAEEDLAVESWMTAAWI